MRAVEDVEGGGARRPDFERRWPSGHPTRSDTRKSRLKTDDPEPLLALMASLANENVQNYPRPPVLETVEQRLFVVLAGQTVAESTRGLRVLETHHAPTYYIPPEDVVAHLAPAPGASYCEWKGRAAYFDVKVGNAKAARAAWSYHEPAPGFLDLAGHIAFYAGKMDSCFVGDERVLPQAGDFYGGWVTRNLQGSIKGAAGTEFW